MMALWNVKRLANGPSEPAAASSSLNRRLFNAANSMFDGRVVDGPLSVAVFRNLDELPLDIQQLFAKAEQENVEFGLSWHRNFVSSVDPNNDGLHIYVLRKNGQAVAAFPVLTQNTALGHRVASLSNYYTSIYTLFMEPEVTAADLVPLVNAVLDAHSPLGSLKLSPMDPDSAAYRTLLSALQTVGLPSFRFFCFGNWYLPVTSDWPSYLRSREGKLRNTIKRMGKAFAAAGGTLELVQGGAELERGIRAYECVYAASWKQPEPYPNFVPGLVRTCAKRGWLRLGIAWLNGDAVAAQIWIVANNKANIYKLAFDENHKKYASGTLLTAMLMQHAFESDRVTEVDYLIGDHPYKKSWMSHRRERWGLVAYQPRSLGGLAGLARELLGRALKPSLLQFRSRMQSLTQRQTLLPPVKQVRWTFLPAIEFASVSQKWESLNNNSLRSPLLCADFVAVALAHFGRGDEWVCFAETAAEPIAAAILQRKNGGLAWETFQPSQMPLGCWLMPGSSNLSAMLQSLLRALPLPAVLLAATELDPLFWPRPDEKPLLTVDAITTGEIDLPDTPEQFLKSFSSKNLTRRIRKAESEIGPITLQTQTQANAVEDFIKLYAGMESRGWKGAAGTALTPGDAQSRFYTDLLKRLAATGRARMLTLKMGKRPVAAQIVIVEKGTLYLLKTTFEPELRHLGPGVMIHYFMTLHGYTESPRVRRIEFNGPLNESQKMWITGTRSLYHVNAYRASLLARAHRHLMDRQAHDARDVNTKTVETAERE